MRARHLAAAVVALCGMGPASSPATRPASGPATRPGLYTLQKAPDPTQGPLVLYLPGISSLLWFDRSAMLAIGKAMPAAEVKVYTWAAYNPGLPALLSYERNRAEAAKVTLLLRREIAARPGRPVYVIGHSGGTGVAAWALEALKPDEKIDQLFLLAPATSPDFDLSGAMKHVRGKVHAFTSPQDPVLGTLTKTFGTIDRKYTPSSGLNGFVVPAGADEAAYRAKLDPEPYQTEWGQLGNTGDHVGYFAPRFVEKVIVPLLEPAR